MLLYLTGNDKSGLIDAAAKEKELTVKKLVGKFSLRSFVTRDMRNYATAKYFAVDFSCVEESLDDFIVVLQSFQMMFSSRIIVILSGCEAIEESAGRLTAIGVVNLVTVDTLDAVTGELAECLSDDGMQKYIVSPIPSEPEQPESPAESEQIEQYQWNAKNIKIAVAGAQRRSGVTVTAFNMAEWLAARGAQVCYVEMNTHRHLQLLITIFDAEKDGEHYAIDGIDCYMTNELDRDHNFILYDCGELRTLPTVFKEADIRLLCGSILPYEIPAFHKAVTACGSLPIMEIGLCVPKEFQDYCISLFGEGVHIIEASHDLFASNVNGQIYLPIVQRYIKYSISTLKNPH
ncbi:hypothetical protein CAFE_30590 [Caprobacter fermentans]|uniref:Uncharacterized protein n=1 Tax=Caproicibacter fermentans TaxID=2576756 RepID=A0A6N8I2H2_9FIRM|nr:hypothetical protein [Caproicibacter fermentans]